MCEASKGVHRQGEVDDLTSALQAVPDMERPVNTERGFGFIPARGKRCGEAEPQYKRALAIDEKAFGPGQPQVDRDLVGLGQLYQNEARYAEAEPQWGSMRQHSGPTIRK